MAILFQSGFEFASFPGDFYGTWTTPTLDKTIFHSGLQSGLFPVRAAAVWQPFSPLLSRVNTRFYARINALPTAGLRITMQKAETPIAGQGPYEIAISRNPSGQLQILFFSRFPLGLWSTYIYDFQPGVWYCFEVEYDVAVGYKVYFEGTLVITVPAVTNQPVQTLVYGNLTAEANAYPVNLNVDDIVIADTYIGPMAPVTETTLSYQSTPISVPMTFNGQTLESGQSVLLPIGATVVISVPPEVTV